MALVRLEDLVDRVAFCDPAGDKKKNQLKRVRSRAAIAVLGQDYMERVFLLHVWADRVPTDTLIRKIFEINDLFAPRRFGIEANAMQTLFASAVRREARINLRRLPLEEVNQPTGIEKAFRNRSALQPIIAEGRFLMQSNQIEAEAELRVHPMGQTNDIVDAIASAAKLLPARSYKVPERTEELELARYLRRTGAPDWYIKKKLAELQSAIAARMKVV